MLVGKAATTSLTLAATRASITLLASARASIFRVGSTWLGLLEQATDAITIVARISNVSVLSICRYITAN